MLLLRTGALPEAAEWLYELKLDGYRALGINSGDRVQFRSRNDNDFSVRYPAIVRALASLPSETVIDGEVVALDESGRPSFNMLQNYGSSKSPILYYYVFDVLVLAGRDVMGMPLRARRDLLDRHILSKLGDATDSRRHSARISSSCFVRPLPTGICRAISGRRPVLSPVDDCPEAWARSPINPRIPACLSYLKPSPRTLDRPVAPALSNRRQSLGRACCSPALRRRSDVLRSCESISDWQPYFRRFIVAPNLSVRFRYSPRRFVPALCGFGDSYRLYAAIQSLAIACCAVARSSCPAHTI